jgi:hypothetical protein
MAPTIIVCRSALKIEAKVYIEVIHRLVKSQIVPGSQVIFSIIFGVVTPILKIICSYLVIALMTIGVLDPLSSLG